MRYFFIYTALSVSIGAASLFFATVWWPLSAGSWEGVIIGFTVAAVFVIAGFLSFYYGIKKGARALNWILFVSMFVRLMLATVILIVLFRFTDLDKQALLISLFAWYLIFQIGEVISFHRLSERKI